MCFCSYNGIQWDNNRKRCFYGKTSTLYFDLMQLSNDISDSNFNVRRYKQMRSAKPITRIHTEMSHKMVTERQFNQSTRNFNSLLKKNTFTAPSHQCHIPRRTLNSVGNAGLRQSSENQNTMKRGQRGAKANKIGVQFRDIESWLNQALMEYSAEEYIDKRVVNAGLKKYSIDMNSLRGKEMSVEEVHRLYKGLSVYSMGFNELVRTLTHKKVQLAKDIWKVYAMLLEYCAEGNHEAVIAQIERDKARQLAELGEQISKLQKVIEHNDVINEGRNKEIFRENKKLNEQNANLLNEKGVLLEEYQISEQAFCQEVALRLKFQSKINEIYGLHRELGLRHSKLHDDLLHSIQSLKNTSQRYFDCNERSSEYRLGLEELREDHMKLSDTRLHDKERIKQFVHENIKLQETIGQWERRALSAQALNQEIGLKLEQVQIDKLNLVLMLDLRQKSAKETHSQYQITLQQNNRLYLTLSDQRKTMEAYEKNKKQFNSRVIKILAEASFFKKKAEQLQSQCNTLSAQHKTMKEIAEKAMLNEKVHLARISVLETNNTQTNELTDAMHKINYTLQQQLQYLRKYEQTANRMYKQKQQQLQQCKEQLLKAKAKQQQLCNNILSLQSQLTLKQQQLEQQKSQNGRLKQQYEHQHEQKERYHMMYVAKTSECELQVEKLTTMYGISCDNLKNEKFERNTLNANYTQLLKIIEKKNEQAKNQGQTISSLKEETRESQRKIQLLEINSINIISSSAATQERLQCLLQQQKQLLDTKYNHVHPMQYEDALQRLDREVKLHIALKDSTALKWIQLHSQIDLLNNQINRLKEYHARDTTTLKNHHEQAEDRINQLYKYEQQKGEALKVKLAELEQLAQSYAKVVQERTTSQREEIYKQTLERKNTHIEQMQHSIELLQDQLTKAYRCVRENNNAEQQLRNAIKKEIQSQYLQIINSLKQQIKAKDLQNSQKHNVEQYSLEDLLKMKGISMEDAAKMLKHNLGVNQNEKQQTVSRRRLMSEESKRVSITKKIKHAYDYYR